MEEEQSEERLGEVSKLKHFEYRLRKETQTTHAHGRSLA